MNKFVLSLVVLILVVMPSLAQAQTQAQQKLTLSVTPPLFQLNIGPGDSWNSSLKVINANPYDITLYTSVVNFEAEGEEGHGRFIPIVLKSQEESANTLAEWIQISKGPIHIPKEKSVDIPFTVRIPQNASPGGHYAAILVGTQPLASRPEGSVIQVSSFVSSLFFVRINGAVVEKGSIREFSTQKLFYQKPEATFTLRFENGGNVHLQPQGDITIYNIWGKEQGKIPVNQETNFGNVLPQSARKFVFEWQGEESFSEVGMYKAVATLTFGQETRQNVFRTTYFWVVPLRQTLGILGSIMVFILFMVWGIRAYIRRALMMAQQEVRGVPKNNDSNTRYREGLRILALPIKERVVDLRSFRGEKRQTFKKHLLFFVFVAILIVGIVGVIIYLT